MGFSLGQTPFYMRDRWSGQNHKLPPLPPNLLTPGGCLVVKSVSVTLIWKFRHSTIILGKTPPKILFHIDCANPWKLYVNVKYALCLMISDTFQTLPFAPTKCGANSRNHVTPLNKPCKAYKKEKQKYNGKNVAESIGDLQQQHLVSSQPLLIQISCLRK